MPTRSIIRALLAGAVTVAGAPVAAMAVADDYRDIKTAMFATPQAAAYCSIGESMEDADPVLKCWTPNDGFVASISHGSGRPQFRYDRRFRAYYPSGYRTLRFGQSTSYRCASVTASFAEDCGYGIRIFACTGKANGLTCFNTTDKWGFWLGRYKGYRTIRV